MSNFSKDGILSTNLTISSNQLKSGITTELTEKEIKFFQLTETGYHRLNSIQLEYTRSFTSNTSRSLLHWRDLLLSTVISLSLRTCFSYDVRNTSLNNLALHFYRNQDESQIWKTDLFNIKKGKTYSRFLTLSYFFKDLNNIDLNFPFSSFKSLLTYILTLYTNTDVSSLSYKEIFDIYNDYLFLSENTIDDIIKEQEYLNKVQDEQIQNEKLLTIIRRNLLVKEDWDDLYLRLFLGEYRKEFNSIISSIDIEKLESRLFNRVRPLGSIGFFLALAGDSLLGICNYINTLPNTIQYSSLNDFFESRNNDNKQIIYNYLSVASYSLFYLQYFNTLKESRSLFNQIKTLLNKLSLENYIVPEEYKLY